MPVLGLDYGLARTGVAISDATRVLARPLLVVERAASPEGMKQLAALVVEHDVDRIVVGLPLTLRGERGEQVVATEAFVEALRIQVTPPIETYDERFTTTLAARTPSSAPEDALAAAHLLQNWLDRQGS